MPRKTKLTRCVLCNRRPRFGVGIWYELLKWPGDPIRPQFKRTAPAVGYCAKHFFVRLGKVCPKNKREQLEAEVKKELRRRKR
jgi:hypothetical protein